MEDAIVTYARFFSYLDRYVEVKLRNGSVISVTFPDAPANDAKEEHPLLDRIGDYLTGTVEADFSDVMIDLEVPEDHQTVLLAVREIPYAENASVIDIARKMGEIDPNGNGTKNTIRTALNANPVPLLIPDHRVRDGPSGAPPAVEQRLRSVEFAGG